MARWCASACSRTSIVARCRPIARDRAHDGGQPALGDELAVVHRERPAQQLEVGHQLVRAEVVGTGFVLAGRAGGEAGARCGPAWP